MSLDRKGASLVEVLVMAGAMLVMMMTFMSFTNNAARNMTYLEDRLSRVSLENELRVQFSGESFCPNLLAGVAAPLKNQSRELNGLLNQALQVAALNQVLQKRGEAFFYDQLEIKKIALEDSDLSSPSSSGAVMLTFYPERVRKGGGPPVLRPVRIKTAIAVGSDYRITSCRAEDESGKGCPAADLKAAPQWVQVTMKGAEQAEGQNMYTPVWDMLFEVSSTTIASPVKEKFPQGSLVLVQGTWIGKKIKNPGLPLSLVPAPVSYVYSASLQAYCQDGRWSWVGADPLSEAARNGTTFERAAGGSGTVRCSGVCGYNSGFTY